MSQTIADFEFYAQDGDASGGTIAPEKGHMTDGNGQGFHMSTKVVKQSLRRHIFRMLNSAWGIGSISLGSYANNLPKSSAGIG